MIAVIAILIFAYSLVRLTTKKEENVALTAYQISAYEDLSNVDNSFYSDLSNALVDIEMLTAEEGKLPEIQTLEEEGISPFVKDQLWENRGALEWQLLKKNGKAYYLGISKNVNVVGNFLIALQEEEIAGSKIYFNQEQDDGRSLPHTLDSLEEHWKEILAYTGKEERKKF